MSDSPFAAVLTLRDELLLRWLLGGRRRSEGCFSQLPNLVVMVGVAGVDGRSERFESGIAG